MQFIDLQRQQEGIRSSIESRIQRVLDHGQYIMGPEVEELESSLSRATGARHSVAVSSGTDALVMALMALGIGSGDEVITSPFSFASSAECIKLVGATPVFADIDPMTYNVRADCVASALTDRTRAVIVVDLYGQCADYRSIRGALPEHIPIIQDGAQSFGATCQGSPSMNQGLIACTSFFPAKPLGCYGDGGALFTQDDSLARIFRELRIHGQSERYKYARVGLNARIDTIQAAILLAKLEVFTGEVEKRQQVASVYARLLPRVFTPPVIAPEQTSVFAQYTIEAGDRTSILNALNEQGIPTAVYYPIPLHRQPPYASEASCPTAEEKARRVFSIPFHPYMQEADVARVCQALHAACERVSVRQ